MSGTYKAYKIHKKRLHLQGFQRLVGELIEIDCRRCLTPTRPTRFTKKGFTYKAYKKGFTYKAYKK
jgi:hypothetical protein